MESDTDREFAALITERVHREQAVSEFWAQKAEALSRFPEPYPPVILSRWAKAQQNAAEHSERARYWLFILIDRSF